MRPYTRSLHPDDYDFLQAKNAGLRLFLDDMVSKKIPHREWHPHRFWEYASILQQLDELNVPRDAEMIDVGAGGSFFDPYLALLHPRLCCTDSMKYGDVTPMVQAQRSHYGVALPLYDLMLEDMSPRMEIGWGGATDKFDVTLCISTIEHVDDFHGALHELYRITKPGGYIFITSDYFESDEQFERSVSRHLQVTAFQKRLVLEIPDFIDVSFVPNAYGLTDLDYRGDFVHNYSFCNVCLQKRA